MAKRSHKDLVTPNSAEVMHLRGDLAYQEEVTRLAHQFWIERGSPIGTPEEDWFRAEAEVRSRRSKPEQEANAG